MVWSESCENALQQIEKAESANMAPLENVLKIVEATLNVLADSVLQEQPPVRRRKLEHLVSFAGTQYSHYEFCKATVNC